MKNVETFVIEGIPLLIPGPNLVFKELPADAKTGGESPSVVTASGSTGLHVGILNAILPLKLVSIKVVIETKKIFTHQAPLSGNKGFFILA